MVVRKTDQPRQGTILRGGFRVVFGECRVHKIPRLCAWDKEVSGGPMPTWVIQTGCVDERDFGQFGYFPEYRRATFRTEASAYGVSGIGLHRVKLGLPGEFKRGMRNDNERGIRCAARPLTIPAMAVE